MPARLPELLRLDELKTPIGTALLLTDGEGVLRALDWHEFAARVHREVRVHYRGADMRPGRAPDRMRKALSAYFTGDFAAIDAIPVAAEGTPFQRKVWAALRRIPVGETLSYSALA